MLDVMVLIASLQVIDLSKHNVRWSNLRSVCPHSYWANGSNILLLIA